MSNFQCFGRDPVTVTLESLTFLIGPNASGKTACLQALSRMFCVNGSMRKILESDFHVPPNGAAANELFIEATFDFPETASDIPAGSVADHYDHMRLGSPHDLPQVRFRLQSTIAEDGIPDTKLYFVLEVDDSDEPISKLEVGRVDRNKIQVHYLPARRNPAEQVSYAHSSVLGRVLRSADWKAERVSVREFADSMNDAVLENETVNGVADSLQAAWRELHRGDFFASPTLSFLGNDLDALLENISIGFGPAHGEDSVEYTRLSDGQQSLLYVSLVLSAHELTQRVVDGEYTNADVNKLRPATFCLVVMEEPENSLSPHSLGRVIEALRKFSERPNSQAVIATHSPSMLKRVSPESIRHFRLMRDRTAVVRTLSLPEDHTEASKYVRQAVQAYPELYFARFVVLGEGDTEDLVLSRVLQSLGLESDRASITVAPLGGRHVNHFWKLLRDLAIPHATLLDLDMGRNRAGWARLRYALKELSKYEQDLVLDSDLAEMPKWNDETSVVDSWMGRELLALLERSSVFFSAPLDLDMSMLACFDSHYECLANDNSPPSDDTVRAVLGRAGDLSASHYSDELKLLFAKYHDLFQLGSKPAQHLAALSSITDSELRTSMPNTLRRLASTVRRVLDGLPE